jgi:probable rRNA maturation factor
MISDTGAICGLVVQYAAGRPVAPSENDFKLWVDTALTDHAGDVAVTIRVVDEIEGRDLNLRYRAKDYATNVLSFPADIPDIIDLPDLGDIVMCAPVVEREAAEQEKLVNDHWAHLVIHAVLHLRGYDHADAAQADEMELVEIKLLASLGIANPY